MPAQRYLQVVFKTVGFSCWSNVAKNVPTKTSGYLHKIWRSGSSKPHVPASQNPAKRNRRDMINTSLLFMELNTTAPNSHPFTQ